MNGLTLRISRGGASKQKNPISFSPVSISTSVYQYLGTNLLFKQLIVSTSTDDQLAILKKILEQTSDVLDIEFVQFLVVLFLEAEAKHPVKCFVSRHVTKNNNLHQPFTEALAAQISRYISIKLTDYKQYVVVVSKIATCVENFNAGVAAVRSVEGELAVYLKDCLYCCSGTLRQNSTLSPTEKNQIYNLAHLSLRLLLHIIQKSSQNSLGKLHLIFGDIRSNINELMRGMDVPMDTKSVCGILYLWMHIIENGPLSWINVLNSGELHCESLGEAAQLSLLSAIPTVVGVDQLQTVVVEGTTAVVVLVKRLLDIGDRNSSESTFILCVTRTIVQISKCLDKLTDTNIGVTLVDMFVVFAWTHLEHYMDSVRHLTAQMLACVVKYSVRLDREGDSSALSKLSMALASLDKSRKSYYISLACLSNELGAKSLLVMMPNVIEEGIHALYSQPVQASASVFLDTLLQKYVSEFTTAELYKSWVVPVLRAVSTHAPECSVFNAMEHLLIRAVKLDERLVNYIIPYIKESCELTSKARDLKCILMLLAVVRKSGVTSKLTTLEKDDEWKGIISYEVLKTAAIDSVDETRVLSLSLIVESPKSTEQFTEADLSFILWYLKYNINAQAPNFRQHTLSFIKKFLKRFEDSYKAMRRQIQPISKHNKVDFYMQFIRELRHQCFESVIPGVNYSRRYVALQILAWCEDMNLEGYHKCWQSEYVERLLIHLEDSYESNKALALDILCGCDVDLIKSKKYSTSIEIKDIFRQASSLKPTDCVSAAYKLDFLRRKLPEYILQDEKCDIPDPVTYTLVKKLVELLEEEVSVCEESVVLAARRAPMYGLLHCIGHLLEIVDPIVISPDSNWKCLVSTLILLCERVSVAVSAVVNNSSPEGHLPMDMTGVTLTDHGNSGNVRLEDGRPVTAQMVLLCAWRSVKEVSLLLGSISSRLTIVGEGLPDATLDVEQVTAIGEHFTSLLAETKHRGAFEQAYVGFTKYLTRLWRCKNPELHERPRMWLQELLEAISSGDRRPLCATRRSAGLPFMIQALVSTELQAGAAPHCLQRCMGALLALGRGTGTKRAQTGTERAQTGTERAQTGTERAQTGTERAQTGTERAQTGTERAQTGTERAQTGTERAQTGTERAQTGTERAQTGTERAQTETERAQTETERAQTETERAQTETERAQTETERAQTGTERAQTGTERAQTETERAQTGTERAQTGTERAQTETERAQTGTERAQTGTERAQTETERAQTGTERAQTGTERAQTGTERAQTETERAQTETERAQTGTERAQTGTERAQTETERAQIGTERAQTGTERAQTETERAQTGTERAQTGTERAQTETEVSCRTHSLNVLRALFRNSVLQEGVTHYVGEGLLLALSGFDGNTWAERNSSTLLFSALTVRVFGVPRDRRLDVLNVRNRMTGRIFFLRYPKLYDFMLEKLKEVTSRGAGELSPSLSPVLLLLARLYPSALEGTVSNLKLVSFVPHVLSCASSSVLHTRQLAAKAIVPLISPEHYIAHIQSMFELIFNVNVPRNFCHGILLQLLRLLDAKPQDLEADMSTEIVVNSLWVLEQAVGDVPCYLIADEYVKVLNMIVWRFPNLLQKETANQIIQYLDTLIFTSATPKITSGRDICLSNAIYLYYVLLHTYNLSTTQLVYKALEHPSYEVVLSTLNYLLVTHNSLDQENCKFIQHLIFLTNNICLEHCKERYFQLLCRLLKNEYLECQQKSLKLLILNGNTQKYIIEAKFGKTTNILDKLFDCVGNEHENLTHVYLQSLLNYITEMLKNSSVGVEVVLKVIRVIFDCSSSDNSESTRNVVVKFMGNNIKKLFSLDTSGLSDENKFELKATIWAIIITLLEDDDHTIRQTICDALTSYMNMASTLPSVCGEKVREHIYKEECEIEAVAMFLLIALLDFRSVVCMTEDGNEECRVFDQNERYNIFLEETVWTDACAQYMLAYKHTNSSVIEVISKDMYRRTFDKLCGDNVEIFTRMVKGEVMDVNDALNPKIALLVSKLK